MEQLHYCMEQWLQQEAVPVGPLSSSISLSVHSSLPALLTVLARVLTPQEPEVQDRASESVCLLMGRCKSALYGVCIMTFC